MYQLINISKDHGFAKIGPMLYV